MANWLARWPLWVRLIFALSAGALGALGQAPFDQPVAMVASLTVGFALWRLSPSRVALTGWLFATGYFAFSLVWILEPFQVDAARHGWMAPFALVFLSAGLALFWATAFWLAVRLRCGAFGLVLTWTGAEVLRAYIFTGFPWNTPAQVTINGAASTLLAWGGPHLATLVLLGLAWVLSLPANGPTKIVRRAGQGVLLVAALLALYLPLAQPTAPTTGFWVRLVQPNAAQHLKWQPDMTEVFFQRQLELTAAPPRDAGQAPDLIVWPETAIPWRLETAQSALTEISDAAARVPVALGGLRTQGLRLRNTLAVVGSDGTINALYDKHHLVPFGEYIPFANVAEWFGLQALAATMGGFGAGPGAEVLDLGALGKAMPLICYEAVFAHNLHSQSSERPDFILQITNDAWFGQYAGPQQHLAQARMRAVEQGVPLVRAANTGISAMIDPFGRMIAALPLNEAGYIDAPLPMPISPTLYSRTGDIPLIVLVVLALCGVAIRGRRQQHNFSD